MPREINAQAAGGTTFYSVYPSGNDGSPCQQIMTSTTSGDTDCLAGGPADMTIASDAIEGSTRDGDRDSKGDGNGDGKNTTTDENGEKKEKKQKRAVRANWY